MMDTHDPFNSLADIGSGSGWRPEIDRSAEAKAKEGKALVHDCVYMSHTSYSADLQWAVVVRDQPCPSANSRLILIASWSGRGGRRHCLRLHLLLPHLFVHPTKHGWLWSA